MKEAPGPGLEAPDQGGEQQHGAGVIQLNPDQSEALDLDWSILSFRLVTLTNQKIKTREIDKGKSEMTTTNIL